MRKIGSLLLIVVNIGLVGVGLYYWNKYQQVATDTPVTEFIDKTINNVTQTNKTGTIIFNVGESKNIAVELNEEKLKEGLSRLNYWNDGAIFDYRQPSVKLTATMISINLVNNLSDYYVRQTNKNGQQIMSEALRVDPTGKVDIDISLDASILKSPPEKIIPWLNSAFWRGVYMSTRFKTGESTAGSTELNQFITSYMATNPAFREKEL